MDKQHLTTLIQDLHNELSTAESLDERSKSLLRELTVDIEKVAADDGLYAESPGADLSQLQEAALKFEREHPKLSMILNEIMDTLSKLGI